MKRKLKMRQGGHHWSSLFASRLFECARRISDVYTRCLDPLLFPTSETDAPDKARIIDAFVRVLATERMLTSLECVTCELDTERALDSCQPDLGTTTVRWLHYLAGEALRSRMLSPEVRPYTERQRLNVALCAIVQSVSVLDRFTALARNLGPAPP